MLFDKVVETYEVGNCRVEFVIKSIFTSRRYHIDLYEDGVWIFHNDFYDKRYVGGSVKFMKSIANRLTNSCPDDADKIREILSKYFRS